MASRAASSESLAIFSMCAMSLVNMNFETFNISWFGECGLLSAAPNIFVEFLHARSEQNSTMAPPRQTKQVNFEPTGIRSQTSQ
jgi:hypothetical protein